MPPPTAQPIETRPSDPASTPGGDSSLATMSRSGTTSSSPRPNTAAKGIRTQAAFTPASPANATATTPAPRAMMLQRPSREVSHMTLEYWSTTTVTEYTANMTPTAL